MNDYNSPIHAAFATIFGESDIPGNYPVLLGIKDNIHTDNTPGWGEVRTKHPILPDSFSGIWVPESKVSTFDTSIPVFSLEPLIAIINR